MSLSATTTITTYEFIKRLSAKAEEWRNNLWWGIDAHLFQPWTVYLLVKKACSRRLLQALKDNNNYREIQEMDIRSVPQMVSKMP
jgi:hypothetical protein